MAKEDKKKCFIIMPITTPKHLLAVYNNDSKHFTHVIESLFEPAIDKIGYETVPPTTSGSYIIQADIIKKIEDADMVLCDMAALNPNVFFELGIRTALNRPVSLVKDDLTKDIPFDTSILNYHTYKSQPTWDLENEIIELSKHIEACIKSSKGQNLMWQKFGISLARSSVPENLLEAKIDLLSEKVNNLRIGYKGEEHKQLILDGVIKDTEEIKKLVDVIADKFKIELIGLSIDIKNQHVFILVHSDINLKSRDILQSSLKLNGINSTILNVE